MPDEFHILLVEDSPSDVLIIGRALDLAGFSHRMTVISDGDAAMAHLEHLSKPGRGSEELPDLVLLDLNLPGPDGAAVLARWKADPTLRVVPVVVLTTSDRIEDVWQSYHAGANTYVQKPDDFDGYHAFAESLRRYWRDSAIRPSRRPPRT